jgi:hypothetical protein
MVKFHSLKTASALVASAVISCASLAVAAPFTEGNVVVLRLGDGTTLLASNEAAPVFLDEYTPAGSLVQSIAIPISDSGGNFGLTLHGAETAVGGLNLSTDGKYLTFAGYNAAPGTTALSATDPAVTARVIARVDFDGVIDTSTRITDGFARIANAITDDGTQFWTSGNNQASGPGGIRYSATLGGTTSTQVVAAPNNLLMLQIFGGQLYTGLVFGPPGAGVATVGTGLPTTTGQTISLLPGFPASTANRTTREHYRRDAATIFVADANTNVATGGLEKWTFDGANWVEATSPFPIASPTAARGLSGMTGVSSGSDITIFATSVDSGATSGNSLVKFVSSDNGATFTPSVLTASPVASFNTLFRGVALAPVDPTASVDSWQAMD